MYIHTNMTNDTSELGWRLRRLRLRRGIALTQIAQRSHLDVSYVSRLERDALWNARPKPSTIDRVLDAMDATWEEREAVYHREREPLTMSEIEQQVQETARLFEEHPEPVELSDEWWYTWYYNRTARAVLGLTAAEYRRAVGSHLLHAMIDPSYPLYSRIPDEDREALFALRAAAFRSSFASQEFDKWYRRVVDCVYTFPWAARLWESPLGGCLPLVLGKQDFTVLSPGMGYLSLGFQSNRLASNPRFLISNWTNKDSSTAIQIAVLRSRHDLVYSYKVGLPSRPKRRHYAQAVSPAGHVVSGNNRRLVGPA